MDIGEEKETYRLEPLQEPVPIERPAPESEPRPQAEPQREPAVATPDNLAKSSTGAHLAKLGAR
jgi:hypothetical protein